MSHKPPPNLAVHPVLLNHWTSPGLLSYHLSNQSYDGFIWKQTELISCLIINVVLHSKHKINLKNMYKAHVFIINNRSSSSSWTRIVPNLELVLVPAPISPFPDQSLLKLPDPTVCYEPESVDTDASGDLHELSVLVHQLNCSIKISFGEHVSNQIKSDWTSSGFSDLQSGIQTSSQVMAGFYHWVC